MDADFYQSEAMKTVNLDLSEKDKMAEAIMGIAGEAGEVVGCYSKKHFQGHHLDDLDLIIEMGDVIWYITQAAVSMGYSLSDVLQANLDKIHRRFPDGVFSAERSINRGE